MSVSNFRIVYENASEPDQKRDKFVMIDELCSDDNCDCKHLPTDKWQPGKAHLKNVHHKSHTIIA